MSDQPLAQNPDRDCRSCEFYSLERRPNDGLFAGRKPYCVALGWHILSTTAAIDCKQFLVRSAVNVRRL